MSRYAILCLLLARIAAGQCVQQFPVIVPATDGDCFVNSSPSCDCANTELDIVRWNGATVDLTLLDYATGDQLAGQQVVSAELHATVTGRYGDASPNIIGDYFDWQPISGKCNTNYADIIGTNAISGFPMTAVPAAGPVTIPLNPVGIATAPGGHTKIRLTFAPVGGGYSEVDFRSAEGSLLNSIWLYVTSTGPACATPTPNPKPTSTEPPVVPTPVAQGILISCPNGTAVGATCTVVGVSP